MALRCYWEQRSKHDVLERIEIHDAQFGGAAFQLLGDETGFSLRYDEITSESNEKLINIQANRIQIGKLDFRPRIESDKGVTLLEDIRDSDNKRFHIVYKKDGTTDWVGWVTTRIFSYPEKDSSFIAHIRATDFEILKGQDFPPEDNRQTFITTFADLFSELPEDTPIKTATSWVEENVTARVGNETYDFLDEVRHETKALRDFGRTGDETDQPITKWEALEHTAEPGLLIRQMGGHVMIDQLTDLADPQNVNETVYDSTGSVTTSTTTVGRRQTGYGSAESGTPSIKNVSQNDTYPAIKRAENTFDHRSVVEQIKLPSRLDFEQTGTANFQQDFVPNRQIIELSGSAFAQAIESASSGFAEILIRVGTWYYNGTNWTQDDEARVRIELMGDQIQINDPDGDYYFYRGPIRIRTPRIPSGATTPLEIQINNAIIEADPDVVADETSFETLSITIEGTTQEDQDAKTASLVYELTQQNFDTPQIIELDDTWFGDGPGRNSPSALRYGTHDSEITSNTWRRRGQAISYRKYHHNLLAEVIDMGRTNMRKLEADIWGAYDPTKVLDYNGSYFYFAGGKYDGTRGKWRVTLMELNLQTDATDDFDDIPKFTDETGSGTGSTSSSGGGLDTGTADSRYLQQSNNLSDLNSISTARSNLGVAIGSDVQAWDDDLDDLAALGHTDGNFIVSDGTDWTTESGATAQSSLGLKDKTADLDLNSLSINGTNLFPDNDPQSLGTGDNVQFQNGRFTGTARVDTGKFLSPASYQFRNAGDTGFRDVEMAGLTATQATLGNLTSGRVLLAGTSGLVEDDASLTFDGSVFQAPSIGIGGSDGTVSGLFVNAATSGGAGFVDVGEHNLIRSLAPSLAFEDISSDTDNYALYLNQSEFFVGRYTGATSMESDLVLKEGNVGVGGVPDTRLHAQVDSPSEILKLERTDTTDDLTMDFIGGVMNIHSTRDYSFSRNDIERFKIGVNSSLFTTPLDLQDTLTGVDADFSSTGEFGGLLTASGNILIENNDPNFKINDTDTTATNLEIFSTGNQVLFRPIGDGAKEFKFDGSGWVFEDLLTLEAGAQINSSTVATDHFSAGSTGWQMSYAGDLEANTITTRGGITTGGDILADTGYAYDIGSLTEKFRTLYAAELFVEVLTASERRVTSGGRFNVATGAATLESSINTIDTTITVSNNGASNGDIIHFEKTGQVEFMSVDSAPTDNGDGTYSYIVTRDLDGSGANSWDEGDSFMNTGQTGAGFIDMYAINSMKTGVSSAGPTTAYMERTGTGFNDINIRALTGNLNGWYGYSSDVYGAAFGQEGGDYVTIDKTDGVRFVDGVDSDTVLAQFNGQKFTLGSGDNIFEIDNSGASLAATIKAGVFDLDANSGDLVLDSVAKQISLNSGAMGFGYDIGGAGLHGVQIDSNNYWYSSKDFKVHQDSSNFISLVQGSGLNVKAQQYLFEDTAGNLKIDSSVPRIDVGSHFLDGSTDTVNFSGGVLTADGGAGTVGLASFTADSDRLYQTPSGTVGATVEVGKTSVTSNLVGFSSRQDGGGDLVLMGYRPSQDISHFQAYQDSNNEVVIGQDLRNVDGEGIGTFTMRMRSAGNDVVHLTPNRAKFFGASVDSGAMWAGASDKADATFLADWANETLQMGDVFSADGSTNTGHLASLEVYPSRIQNVADTFRMDSSGLSFKGTGDGFAPSSLKWYETDYASSNLQKSIRAISSGLETRIRNSSTGNMEVVRQTKSSETRILNSFVATGAVYAHNLPTDDPEEQGRIWYDQANDKLTISAPNDPSIFASGISATEILLTLDNATSGPYDIFFADGTQIALDQTMPYTVSGLSSGTEYSFYVIDNNGNQSNTATAFTESESPSITTSLAVGPSVDVNLFTASTSPYDVFRNGTIIANGIAGSSFPYNDTAVSSGNSYDYQIRDANGNFSNVSTANL